MTLVPPCLEIEDDGSALYKVLGNTLDTVSTKLTFHNMWNPPSTLYIAREVTVSGMVVNAVKW